MSFLWIFALASLAILNGFASNRLVASQALSRRQRAIQLLLVWFVPVVGAVLTLIFLSMDTLHAPASVDKTAFVDNVDAVNPDWNAPPGSSICGCSGSGEGGGGDGD